MYDCKRKFFVMPAENPEVKRAISLFLLAKEDAEKAFLQLQQYDAVGLRFIEKRGWAIEFDHCEEAMLDGLSKPFKVDSGRWAAFPDKRRKSGKDIDAVIEEILDLNHIYRWSIEKSLGIFGAVNVGMDVTHYWCMAKALDDGRIIVSSPIDDFTEDADGNFVLASCYGAPEIPDWAIEINEAEYKKLVALPGLAEKSEVEEDA